MSDSFWDELDLWTLETPTIEDLTSALRGPSNTPIWLAVGSSQQPRAGYTSFLS